MHSKENYRPVSCLTTISKLIEYEMNSQMVNHAKTFFSDKLSAFRKGVGCEQVIMNVTEQWKNAMDNDQIVGTILMDLSKAFDCLPHQLFISKLDAYGYSQNACMLVARKQRVKHYGNKSEWTIMKKGFLKAASLSQGSTTSSSMICFIPLNVKSTTTLMITPLT